MHYYAWQYNWMTYCTSAAESLLYEGSLLNLKELLLSGTSTMVGVQESVAVDIAVTCII